MNIRRISIRSIIYRIRQFVIALIGKPNSVWVARAKEVLTDEQEALFLSLQPNEQTHALTVFRKLLVREKTPDDLLVAALLHDVGKTYHPLSLWDRVLSVLAMVFFPDKFNKWGLGTPKGWRRPFVVACQHPYWGAELAIESGASPLTAALIRHHQDETAVHAFADGGELLRMLQQFDRES